MPNAKTLGVIADTHGLLRRQALTALAGSDLIVHAGDIGGPAVLAQLERVAPVVAVRGNNDVDEWGTALPEIHRFRCGEVEILVVHDLHALALNPGSEGVGVVISGHSHKPKIERRGETLYLNPGAAGPRRFRLPVAVARLVIDGRSVQAEIIEIPL